MLNNIKEQATQSDSKNKTGVSYAILLHYYVNYYNTCVWFLLVVYRATKSATKWEAERLRSLHQMASVLSKKRKFSETTAFLEK